MRKIFSILILLILSFYLSAQDTAVNWMSFEQVAEQFSQKQKPIFIFSYDSDDELSTKMFNETLKNEEVVKYLNVVFYSIKFDIKTKDTVTFFNGVDYLYNYQTGYHSLTHQLLGDSISAPSLVMFNKQAQGRAFYGYKNRDSIFSILIYYNEEIFTSTEYDDWEKIYFQAYPPGQTQIISRLNVKWLTMEEMIEKQKVEPRKVFIDIYNNYNVGQTVMRMKVYNDPLIAKYLNENYYPVSLGYKALDTFDLKGVTYKNNVQTGYHEFAISVLNANMRFPAFIILDEEYNLLDRIQVFTTKDLYDDLIHYYGDNAYKNSDFQTFKANRQNID